MGMTNVSRTQQRGIGYVLVLFMIFVVAGLSMGLLQEGMAARTSLTHHVSNMRALELAEAGLVVAEMEVRAQVDAGTDGIGAASGTLGDGTYDVTVTADPASEDRWILNVVGRHRLSARRLEVGIRRRLNSHFADALFSLDDLTVSSVATDAYDSRLGSYLSQTTNADGGGSYAEQGGGLGSNGDIYLEGSAVWVRGNTIPGPLRDVYESGGPTVYGDQVPREFELDFPPVSYDEFLAAMNNNNNSNIGGQGNGNSMRYNAAQMSLDVTGGADVVLPAGTYFFKSVHLRGGSTLSVTGPVKIYVTDTFDIGADAKLAASKPADMQIFAHPYALPDASVRAETLVKVAGGSSVAWSLYAPGAALDIGGGNSFFGAAAAKRIELQGANSFHYDKALGAFGIKGEAIIERLYWKETPLPRP